MISDRLVHASIVDGIRLAKAMHDTYKHCDMAHLEESSGSTRTGASG